MAGRIKKRKTLSYAKWGYIFILPFFIIYAIFQLYPLITTFVYAFQDVNSQGIIVNNGWNNFDNFRYLFVQTHNEWLKTFGRTMIMQFMGFIPQLIVSLVLAVWFTDSRLKLKGATFFKAIIYMPNLIMATAMASMFQSMFNQGGPFYTWYANGHGGMTIFDSIWDIKWLVGFINFTMWFGNTTILLMAGVMGIDDSIFEAATIDGAGPIRTFKDITMPLLMPIFVYVFLTSLIGGIQMFDIPANLIPKDGGRGGNRSQICTIIMYLNQHLSSGNKQFGVAGAISIMLFLVTAVLSFVVYKVTATDMSAAKAKKRARAAKKVNA
ncbi:MAG: sugar ABC transporter permease [Acholeplasmatales bacterium]|nr:sugar ABC transporter permease [Acholeplasmatales bacterium]